MWRKFILQWRKMSNKMLTILQPKKSKIIPFFRPLFYIVIQRVFRFRWNFFFNASPQIIFLTTKIKKGSGTVSLKSKEILNWIKKIFSGMLSEHNPPLPHPLVLGPKNCRAITFPRPSKFLISDYISLSDDVSIFVNMDYLLCHTNKKNI